MPRIGRLHVDGGYYHLIGRGLERRAIFDDDSDKREFLKRFGRALQESEVQCLAWALMSNHYHFLVRVHSKPLSRMMHSLLGGYAGYYNRRLNRVGYVFQNRYKPILCDAESYLLELVRYINLNPIRAGMLPDLDTLNSYPWTGHAGMLGRHRRSWHDVESALACFGENIRKARFSYKRFVGAGHDPLIDFEGGGLVRSLGGWESVTRLKNEHITSIGDERILGDSRFVEDALDHDRLIISKQTLRQRQGWTFRLLIERVCSEYGIREKDIGLKARANTLSLAKALICYWGNEELGLTCREMGAHLGISQQAVSSWVDKGRVHCAAGTVTLAGFVD